MPGERPARRLPDRVVTTREFTWAVKHLLGGEKLAVLARRDGVSVAAVSQGIKRLSVGCPTI